MSKKNDEMMTGVKVQKSRTDKIFDFFLYTISTIIVIVMLYPMYFIVIASFSNPADVSAGNIVLLPKGITFKGYQKLLEYSQLWVGYKNTILYAALGTVISLVVNVPTAYALSRKDLCGRKLFTVFYLIPMFFTGGLIPTYLIVKDFGLLDNFWVMVLPFSVITYYIIVARTFFNNSIPGDLWEAAQIDGCGNLGFFFQIVIPLSKAVLAVIALWTAVGQWNSFMDTYLYARELPTLQYILYEIIENAQIKIDPHAAALGQVKNAVSPMSVRMAVTVIATVPILLVYPFLQKYFVGGMTLGAVKD